MYQDLNKNQASTIDLKDQWNSVLKKLNSEYGNEIFNSWIKNISIKNLDCKIESSENSEDLKAEFLSIIYREKIFYETLEIRKKIYSFTKTSS